MTLSNDLFKSWLTPTAMLAFIGLIIWLVQLNFHALQSTERNGQQDQIQREILAKQVEVSNNVNQAALILEMLVDDVKALRYKVDTHQSEAEKWKEKIRRIETELSTHGD